MKRSFFSLLILGFVWITYSAFNGASSNPHIEWLTNYDEAVKQSKATSKPIVLFFTGSDWCTWCNKLEIEILDTPEFIKVASDKFIFVKLDFPMNKAQAPAIAEQNQKLQAKYEVRGYPTLILIDQNGEIMGTTGYRAIGGERFAFHMIQMADVFTASR
jgi:protein disulfide-isomerase